MQSPVLSNKRIATLSKFDRNYTTTLGTPH